MTDSPKKDPSRHAPEEIDEYLKNLPEDRRAALTRLRDIIRKTIPGCTERVGYQVPIFRYKKDIVGMASQKRFCSLYTMSPELTADMKRDLAAFEVKGATIHFEAGNPIPEELIRKIVNYRLREKN